MDLLFMRFAPVDLNRDSVAQFYLQVVRAKVTLDDAQSGFPE